MQYGQIVFILFIAFLLYYAVLIVMDKKAKAAQLAEQDNHAEEEIDISDEAQTFKPIKISRDEPGKTQEPSEDNEEDEAGQKPQSLSEQPFHRPGYREAIMTDGILVEDIIGAIDRLAETGTCDLGTLIFTCENVR